MASSPVLADSEVRTMDVRATNDEANQDSLERTRSTPPVEKLVVGEHEAHQAQLKDDIMADEEDNGESSSSEDLPRLPLEKDDDDMVKMDDPGYTSPPAQLVPVSLPLPAVVSASDREATLHPQPSSVAETSSVATPPINKCVVDHTPKSLPRFHDTNTCMWTSSHAANAPSEDRSSSFVNVLLKPLDSSGSSDDSQHSLIRLSMWSVIDGHGGGCVATYASEVLLPHVAASVSRALECEIVDRGECRVNGELRDASDLDLDVLIRSSGQSNPNSIHYRSPREPDEQEDDEDANGSVLASISEETADKSKTGDQEDCDQSVASEISLASSLLPRDDIAASVASAKTSVKTAASAAIRDGPTGTHSPNEIARITHAITESFLSVDEGWINSIDVLSTTQSTCQTNGRWNAGACALVVFVIQRLDWTSHPQQDLNRGGPGGDDGPDTGHNRDAARRRMLDYANKGKSASSLSTMSSTSSLMTNADQAMESAFESEITETEDDEENEQGEVGETRRRKNRPRHSASAACSQEDSLISTPGGCGCHFYRAHDAMLYTAHVGDCRAVLLGNAPPRTIKVPPDGKNACLHTDTTDEESSHSSDETEYMSSSDHDAAETSSEDDDKSGAGKSFPHLAYMRRPARHQGVRTGRELFVVPAERTNKEVSCSSGESENEFDVPRTRKASRKSYDGLGLARRRSSASDLFVDYQYREELPPPPPLYLSPLVRPVDLTTDHSAYNPAEVAAVLRRCNNAPRAISAGLGGGIKRVAGSLAVTRALGDAYLKTPLLSFSPFKKNAPYISAMPEVNCRLLPRDGDPKTNNVLILATDGVWERASGEDVLRWVKNFYAERVSEDERRNEMPHSETDDQVMSSPKKRKLRRRTRRRKGRSQTSAADVIVRRVLNKVRRSRNMSSLNDLISLPKGRARRSKHDDITTCVVDLGAFV